MMKLAKIALAAAALAGFAGVAQAGTYTTGTSYYVQDSTASTNGVYMSGQTVTMSIRKNDNTAGGAYSNSTVGTFGLQTATNQSSGPWTQLLTYCLDVDQGLSLQSAGTTTSNALYKAATVADKIGNGGNSLDDFNQTAIAAAVDTTVNKVWNNVGNLAAYFNAAIDVRSAALQIVLWEIFDEAKNGGTTYSLTAGYFRVQAGSGTQTLVYNLANTILGSISGWATGQQVVILTNLSNQDFITPPTPPGQSVAEPASLALMLIGLSGMLRSRRRAIA